MSDNFSHLQFVSKYADPESGKSVKARYMNHIALIDLPLDFSEILLQESEKTNGVYI